MRARLARRYIGFEGDPGAERYALGRRFYITQKHYFGLAPPEAQHGDLVAILFGAAVPFVVRKVEGGYRLIGETHLQGIMNGEAFDKYRSQEWLEKDVEILNIV